MTANGQPKASPEEAQNAQVPAQFYRQLFRHHHAVMLLIDPTSGAILHANDAACRFYGHAREALTRLKVTDLNTLPASDVQAFMQTARGAASGPFAFQHRLADGRLRDVEVFSGPIEDGGRTLLVSIVHDVTDRKRVEARLRENERRLSLAIRATADAIWEWNPVTNETYFSPRWYEMLGYGDREIPMTFEGWKKLCHPDDFDPTMALIRSHLASSRDQPYAAEFRMRAQDDRWLWILGRGRVVDRDADGHPVLVSGTNTDISAYKKAQQALQESERFHRQALESIPGMVFTTGPDGHCDYQSRQWETFTGVPVSEHLGEGWNRLLHPDDQARALDAWREAVAGRRPYDLEYRVRRRDGVYEWFRAIGQPIRDAEGHIVRWLGVAMNIERLKQAEAALRLSEEKFRSAFAEARIGFALRSPDGYLVDANPAYCTLTGYTLDELRSFHFEKLIHPDDLAANQALVEDMLAGEMSSFVVENRYLRKNGTAVWVRKSVSMVRDDKGRPQWFNTLVEDITERKQEEAARREINDELTEYAYALTHNLKAPLRAVQNYTRFLYEDLAETLEGEPRRYLEGIRIAVRQGHDQIEDLENLYRTKHHEVSIETFALQNLFDEMQAIFENRPDRQLVAARDCPELRGERFLLRQTLIELIRNGFKFNRAKVRRVTLGCRPAAQGKGLEICVQDNGIGIAPLYHEQIFRIFQRLHTEREYEGTGIGLAIVKRAVQKMGGTLGLDSEAGRGSRFRIHLPEAMVSDLGRLPSKARKRIPTE
jgi:PAS domain S-box-containing protein